MKLRDKIKMLNTPCTYLFKPGYPVGKGVYMCRTKDQEAMLGWFPFYGLSAFKNHCGHDRNCDGDLFTVYGVKED